MVGQTPGELVTQEDFIDVEGPDSRYPFRVQRKPDPVPREKACPGSRSTDPIAVATCICPLRTWRIIARSRMTRFVGPYFVPSMAAIGMLVRC